MGDHGGSRCRSNRGSQLCSHCLRDTSNQKHVDFFGGLLQIINAKSFFFKMED